MDVPPSLRRRPMPVDRLLSSIDGPTRSALAGPLWCRPYRGVAAWAALDPSDPEQRILAAAAALGDTPLGGWAAAFWQGATELDGQSPGGDLLPIVFCPGRSGTKRPRDGLQALRSRLCPGDVVTIRRITVTAPARTALDLARTASTVADGVADVEAMLRAPRSRLRVDKFSSYVAGHPHLHGIVQAREVVELVAEGALSRPESRLRVVWVRDAELPSPRINLPVFSRRTGRSLGLPDLMDAESGLVAEYDGAHHREVGQHTRDNAREERFEDAGLTVVRFTAVDLRDVALVAARLRNGYQRARQQRHRGWFVP